MDSRHFDVVIIGAGQAGGPLAGACANAGRSTALIERAHVGGTCINVGCTPTKTMVASARIAYLARRADEYGISTESVRVQLSGVRQRKDEIVRSFRGSSERRLDAAGVELIRGDARFIAPHTLEVRSAAGETDIVDGAVVCINTGGRPLRPPLPGLDALPWLDSSSIMELDDVPDHLLVLGGGYIGLEFAQMFRRFGSEVTVIQRGDRVLTREDPDIADDVASILREEGIEVLLSTEALAADAAMDGRIRLRLGSQDGQLIRSGSHLLVATGRMPNTESLGLEAANVNTDERGFIRVNDKLETSAPGVFAMGDVKGGPQFTHISYDDFRILRANLLDGRESTITGRLVPYTVFIDPQLGRVGMTETEAREAGRRVRIARLPMSHVARAIEMNETRGFMKVVLDADTSCILGAAVLGIEGGEIMGMLQIAMLGSLPYQVLRDGIFAHPTLSEALNNLFADGALQ